MNVDSILQEIGAMKTKMNKKEKIVKTPEEAIETIKSNMPTSGYQMLRESLIMAIGALEKQIQKKCAIDSCPDHTHYKCPSCGRIELSIYKHGFPGLGRITKYCPYCGQAIAENLEVTEDE